MSKKLAVLVLSLVASLTVSSSMSAVQDACTFTSTRVLSLGSKNTDVQIAQRILNLSTDTRVASTGAGSPGQETTYFGLATRNAVIKFQKKYGVTAEYAKIGKVTRAKLSDVCRGTATPKPVNGVCGTSNGKILSSTPTSNLCYTGTPSSVTGSATTGWSWTCAGVYNGTTATCSAKVKVASLPTVSLYVASSTVGYSKGTTVSWSSMNATTCTMSNGSTGTSGSFATGNLTTATTYSLTCTGAGGSASKAVTVNVLPQPVVRSLTVSTVGSGTVTSSGGSINCVSPATLTSICFTTVNNITTTTLTATPSSGYTFSGWSGGTCSGTSPICSLSIDGVKSVVATFTASVVTPTPTPTPTTYSLTVSKVGSGTVTSSGGSINCGTLCSTTVNNITTTTLTATPATGYTFSGWSGGTCSGTTLTCSLSIDGVKSVVATFTVIPVVVDPINSTVVLDDFSGPRLNSGLGSNIISTYLSEDPGQLSTISGNLLTVTGSPSSCGGSDCGIYWQFQPYPYTSTLGFAKGWTESGIWNSDANRLQFKFMCDANVAKTTSGYGNVQIGTYVKKDDGNGSNQGAHYYHHIDPNVYNGRWISVDINRTPQHQVGMSTDTNWSEDPIWNNGTGAHYFDALTRFYFDTQGGFSGVTCKFSPVTFTKVSNEPDQQVSSITYQYTGTRYEVTWSGPKNSTLRYDVAYSPSSMKVNGFSAGTTGGTVQATGNTYTNVLWASSALSQPTNGMYVAIRPQGQTLFTEVYIPFSNAVVIPTIDTIAPSVPSGLTTTPISTSQINLAWSPSTDNVGVVGYKVFRGGVQIATTTTTSYQNTGLTSATTYSYTVSAYDARGNTSNQATPVSGTTQTTVTPISGTCGTSNNTTVSVAPTTNLCSTGTASSVSGTGPWTWTCAGSNGGTTASCSAQKTVVTTPTGTTPTISSVSGTIQTGQTLTITGSSMVQENRTGWDPFFTTRTNASGFEGSNLLADYGNSRPCHTYDTSVKLMGSKSLKISDSGASSVTDHGGCEFDFIPQISLGTGPNDAYFRVYSRWNNNEWPNEIIKYWWLGGSPKSAFLNLIANGGSAPTKIGLTQSDYNGGNMTAFNLPDGALQNNKWYLFELRVQKHVSTGTYQYEAWVDNKLVFSVTSSSGVSPNTNNWGFGSNVNYWSTSPSFVSDQWQDGFVIASSRVGPASLIEISNNATYGAGTMVYQSPTYLSDGSIQVTANLAGLGSGPYYLWVTNSGKARSQAYSLGSTISTNYTLSLSTSNGSIGGTGITTCTSSCTSSLSSGTSVTLTATPVTGYTFSGWTGACAESITTCTISMTSAKSVGATFTQNVVTPPTVGDGGRQLYVSTTGNDSVTRTNNSITNPWRTITHALYNLQAGDTLNVRAGTYTPTYPIVLHSDYRSRQDRTRGGDPNEIMNAQTGTASQPVVVRAYPGDLKGSVVIDAAGKTTLINLDNKSYWTFDGLKIINTSRAFWVGEDVTSTNNIFQNLDITMSTGGDNHGGITLNGFTTENTKIHNNKITGPGTGVGIHQNTAGIWVTVVENVTITNNEVSNAPIGIYYKHSNVGSPTNTNVRIANNYIYNTSRNSIQLNARYAVVENNIFGLNNASVLFAEANGNPGGDYNTFTHNTVFSGGLYLPSETQDRRLPPNNTLAPDDMPGSVGNIIKDNIIFSGVSIHPYLAMPHSTVMDYNLYVGTITSYGNPNKTLSQWKTIYGQDMHSIEGSPSFVGGTSLSGFALSNTSLGRGTGSLGSNMGANPATVGQNIVPTIIPNIPTAPVAPTTYTLTLSTSNGSIGGTGITTCTSSCTSSLSSGTSVTLTATPVTGYTFSGWTGACAGTNITCTVSMTSAKSVGATFTQNVATPTPVSGVPMVLYTDALSGPTTGGENNNGSYLSIFGKNFYSGTPSGMGSSVKVYIGGNEVANYRYMGPSKVNDVLGIQQITVQVGALGNPAQGTPIPVTVVSNGVTSSGNVTFTPNPGRILFVSLSGNDTTAIPGDITHPYRYLQALSGNVYTQSAYGAMRAGDHIVIRGGNWSDISAYDTWLRFTTSYSDSVATPSQAGLRSGKSPNGTLGTGWVHITAYPGPVNGNAIEDVHYSTPAGKKGGIHGPNSAYRGVTGDYISVSNLRMDVSATATSDAAPINSQYANGPWRAVNNDLGPWPVTGAIGYAGGIAGDGLKNYQYYGNYIHDIASISSSLTNHGIYVSNGDNGDIAYNHIARITGGNGFQAADTTMGYPTDNTKIHHNVIHDITKHGVNLGVGVRANNSVYTNLIYNIKQGCIRFYADDITSMKVYNNTCYNTNIDRGSLPTLNDKHWYGVGSIMNDSYSLPANLFDVKNNIFWPVTDTHYIGGAAGLNNGEATFSNNLFFGGYSGDTDISLDTSKVTTSPSLVNPGAADFRLQGTSPAINAGTAIPSAFISANPMIMYDLDMKARSTFDIGAYER